jgi:DNA polymerase III delta subunit
MRAFLKEMQSGFKSPAYVLYSDEPYLLYEAKTAVKKSVPPEAVDFAFECFDAGEPSLEMKSLLDALRSVPFLGGRMVVVLENTEELRPAELKPIQDYLEKPEPGSLFIMLLKAKKVPDKFSSAKIIPLSMGEEELKGFLRQKAKDEGVTLSEDVLEFLMESFDMEPGLIVSEIKKLSLFGEKRLEIADLKEITEGTAEAGAFDLIGALRAGDYARAFAISRHFRAQPELGMLIGAINKEYTRRVFPPGGVREKIFGLIREADIKGKSMAGLYPVEDLLIGLVRALREKKPPSSRS